MQQKRLNNKETLGRKEAQLKRQRYYKNFKTNHYR